MKASAKTILTTVCLGMMGILSLSACNSDSKQIPPAAVVRAKPQVTRELGMFREVEGTTYLMAAITARGEGGFLSKLESGSSGYGGDALNYVFFNKADDSTRRLLPNNDSLILNALRFPKEGKVEWFVYEVVKSDTNNDKELSYLDRKAIAVSDSGGQGYTELIPEVQDQLGYALSDANTLLVLYVKDAKKRYAKIDLPNRKLIVTNELPSLGDDVK